MRINFSFYFIQHNYQHIKFTTKIFQRLSWSDALHFGKFDLQRIWHRAYNWTQITVKLMRSYVNYLITHFHPKMPATPMRTVRLYDLGLTQNDFS